MRFNLFKKNKQTKTILNSGISNYYPLNQGLQALDFPIIYRAYTDREFVYAYETVMPLANSIDLIAEQIQAITPKVWDTNKLEFVNDHPILELLEKPNKFSSKAEFLQRMVASFLSTGNSYIVATSVSPNSPPLEIHNILPQDTSVIINQTDCYPQNYETFMCGRTSTIFSRIILGGNIHFFDETRHLELHHIKNASMRNQSWRSKGYSKLNAIMYEIALYVVGTLYNQSMLQNQGRPVGVFSPETTLTEDQASGLTTQLTAVFEGAHNAGRTLILPVNMNYKELSKTAKDMEYSILLKMVNEAVYNRFGIPLSLIQSNSLSLANMEVAMTQLYTRAVIPVLNRIDHELTNFLMPRYPNSEGLMLFYDKKEIDALMPAQIEKLTKENSLNALSTNEVRAELNREPISGGDEVLAPSNLVPIGETESVDDFIESDDANPDTA